MKYLLSILLGLFLVSQGNANSRTALVIGNSDYKLMPLTNLENDAEDISEKLKTLKHYIPHVIPEVFYRESIHCKYRFLLRECWNDEVCSWYS